MAPQNITFTIKAQGGAYVKDLEQIAALHERMIRQMSGIERASKRASRQSGTVFSKFTRDLGPATAALLGLGSAMQGIATAGALIRAEFERVKQLRTGASERYANYSREMMIAQANIGEDIGPWENQISKLAAIGGWNEEGAAPRIFGRTRSAAPGLSPQEAMDASRVAAGMTSQWQDPEGSEAYSKFMALIYQSEKQKYGGKVPYTMEALGGMIERAFPNMRTVNPVDFAQNLGSAIPVLMKQSDVSLNEALAILGAIGSAANEERGLRTASGTVKAFMTMPEHLAMAAQGGGYEGMPMIRRQTRDKVLGMGGHEMIEWLQGRDIEGKNLEDKELREQKHFLAYLMGTGTAEKLGLPEVKKIAERHGIAKGAMVGEIRTLPQLRELFSPGGDTYKEYMRGRADMLDILDPEQAETAERIHEARVNPPPTDINMYEEMRRSAAAEKVANIRMYREKAIQQERAKAFTERTNRESWFSVSKWIGEFKKHFVDMSLDDTDAESMRGRMVDIDREISDMIGNPPTGYESTWFRSKEENERIGRFHKWLKRNEIDSASNRSDQTLWTRFRLEEDMSEAELNRVEQAHGQWNKNRRMLQEGGHETPSMDRRRKSNTFGLWGEIKSSNFWQGAWEMIQGANAPPAKARATSDEARKADPTAAPPVNIKIENKAIDNYDRRSIETNVQPSEAASLSEEK